MGGVAVRNNTDQTMLVIVFCFLWVPLPKVFFSGARIIQPGEYSAFNSWCASCRVYACPVDGNVMGPMRLFLLRASLTAINIVQALLVPFGNAIVDVPNLILGQCGLSWLLEFLLNWFIEQQVDQLVNNQARILVQDAVNAVMNSAANHPAATGQVGNFGRYCTCDVTFTLGLVTSRLVEVEGRDGVYEARKYAWYNPFGHMLWA